MAPSTSPRADGGDFTFDRYDFASFTPGLPSDIWQFRGLLDGVQQFTFLDTTASAFATRTTGQPGLINTLELSVATGSVAAAVADNFVFTLVSVPEPSTLVMAGICGLIGLAYTRHHRKRATSSCLKLQA